MLGLGLSLTTGGVISSPAAILVAAFKSRVIADGGTVESPSCAKSDVKFLLDNPEPVDFTGLLNDYSGAAAAYSLRQLSSTYTGNAIKVRRSSDNAEQDIAFTNNELDTASLETFAGAGDAFVTIWYDQSGSGNDATQTTAASQPKIVSSGSTILENGKATLDFDGSNDNLIYSSNFMGGSSGSGFSVSSFDNNTRTSREIIYGYQDTSGARYDFLIARQASNASGALSPNVLDFYVEGNFEGGISSTITDTNQHLFSAIYSNGVRRILYNNGSPLGTYTNVNLGNIDDGVDFIVGSDITSTAYIDGKIQEIVIWNTDQSTNRTGIETNINDFYSIY